VGRATARRPAGAMGWMWIDQKYMWISPDEKKPANAGFFFD